MRERGRIALVLGLGQALGRGALALYTIVLVRELSRVEYGDLAYAIAAAAIAIAVADIGFSRLIVRDIARVQDDASLLRDMLLVRSLGLLLATGATALCLVVGVLPFKGGLALGFGLYLLAESVSFGFESVAVALERPWRFAAVQAVSAVAIALAFVAVAVAKDPDAATAMTALALAAVVKSASHLLVWRRQLRQAQRRRPLPVGRWLRQAAPFFVLIVCTVAYYRLGIVVLHGMEGPRQTAPFAAAMRLVDAVALLGYVAFSAVSPVVSRTHRDAPQELWALWRRMVLRSAPAVAVGVCLIALFSEGIAGILFGEAYREPAGTLIRLLAPAMGILVLQSLSGSVLLMSDDHRMVVRLTMLTLAFNLALTIVLVSVAGAEGAAVATTAAELVTFTAFALLIRRRYRGRSWRGL